MKKQKCPFCKSYVTVVGNKFISHGPSRDGSFECEGSQKEFKKTEIELNDSPGGTI
jgi:hypothetical protein